MSNSYKRTKRYFDEQGYDDDYGNREFSRQKRSNNDRRQIKQMKNALKNRDVRYLSSSASTEEDF